MLTSTPYKLNKREWTTRPYARREKLAIPAPIPMATATAAGKNLIQCGPALTEEAI
jgi:hypothetical protein